MAVSDSATVAACLFLWSLGEVVVSSLLLALCNYLGERVGDVLRSRGEACATEQGGRFLSSSPGRWRGLLFVLRGRPASTAPVTPGPRSRAGLCSSACLGSCPRGVLWWGQGGEWRPALPGPPLAPWVLCGSGRGPGAWPRVGGVCGPRGVLRRSSQGGG